MAKLEFKDLKLEDMIHVQELVSSNDDYKTGYLFYKSMMGEDEWTISEKFYMDHFLCFENKVVDADGSCVKVKSPYSDQDAFATYFKLYGIMKANFEVSARTGFSDSTEVLFVNREHKAILLVDINDNNMINQTKMIIPVKYGGRVIISEFDHLPNNLSAVMNQHIPREWPVLNFCTKSYFSNNESTNYMEEFKDDDLKSQAMCLLNVYYMNKVEDPQEIFGQDNMMIANGFRLIFEGEEKAKNLRKDI